MASATYIACDMVKSVENGMLVFDNIEAFNFTLNLILSKPRDYFYRWESRKGYKSFYSAYSQFTLKKNFLESQIFFGKRFGKGYNLTLDLLHEEFKESKKLFEVRIASNGEILVDKNLIIGQYSYLLNEDGMVKIGKDVYMFAKDYVANISKGYYRTNLRVENIKPSNDCGCKNGVNSEFVQQNSRITESVDQTHLFYPSGSTMAHGKLKRATKTRINILPDIKTVFGTIPRLINPTVQPIGPLSDPWERHCDDDKEISKVAGKHRINFTQKFVQAYDPLTNFFGTYILFTIKHEMFNGLGTWGPNTANINIKWYTWALQTPIISVFDNQGVFVKNQNIQFQFSTGTGFAHFIFPSVRYVEFSPLIGYGLGDYNLIPNHQIYNAFGFPNSYINNRWASDWVLTPIRPIIQGSNAEVEADKNVLGRWSKIGCQSYWHD